MQNRSWFSFTGNKAIRPLDIMECKDGWIYICCVEEHQWKGFVDIMGNPEWADESLFATRLDRAENWDALELFMAPWVKEQTVEELYHKAQARRIPSPRFRRWETCSILNISKLGGFFAEILTLLLGSFPIPRPAVNSRLRLAGVSPACAMPGAT